MTETTKHSAANIKTRVLIISDTHGAKPRVKLDNDGPTTDDEISQGDLRRVPTGYREPLPEADVVVHCGDLTKRSLVHEYENTFSMLRAITAPLKVVIAGNHDLALDGPYWRRMHGGDDAGESEVWEIVDAAKADGVHYLTEGVHEFTLDNGARLKVYASQHTPEYGGWAFQYRGGHDFDIPTGIDIAVTHGPPLGVLDFSAMGNKSAGCPHLFAAVARARPKIHCFGHIHEAWGSVLAQWKQGSSGAAGVIDTERSRAQQTLRGLQPVPQVDDGETVRTKRERLGALSRQRGMHIDLTEGEDMLAEGEQTLFINAAVMNIMYKPVQLPWLVDLNLPRAGDADS